MMNYIYVTYDAIEIFASDRFFQSAEFAQSDMLCDALKGNEHQWNHSSINEVVTQKGLIFTTENIDRYRGLRFDLTTFKGFYNISNDKMISIFQKTIKYAIRYFENYPLASCEKPVSGELVLVYPFPFTATRNVEKVYIDKNTSKECKRKGYDILTAYAFGTDDHVVVSLAQIDKLIVDIENLEIKVKNNNDISNNSIVVTDLAKENFSIDANIGYEHWDYWLTNAQKKFIHAPVEGPERLEGAAGTGKTLSMILRCIALLLDKIQNNKEYHIIFITHSLSTKKQIIESFRSNWSDFDKYQELDNGKNTVSISITTLQEWCANHLGTNSISDNEYLDKDASDSKMMQALYIEQAYTDLKSSMWEKFKVICSQEFIKFIEYTSKENLLEMMQREIAVLIKGRVAGKYEAYQKLNRPSYSMPLKNDGDINFMYEIYRKYQAALERLGQYDSDDIILSALGQLDTPIWKRRRIKDGYDCCFIDESHLFNINELSIFHHINKPNVENHIVFAIDKTQAVGDWGISDQLMRETFGFRKDEDEQHRLHTVFRSSPEIANLAYNVLASGATLFTNFENPMDQSYFNFTQEEERKCTIPSYTMFENDDSMIEATFEWVNTYVRNNGDVSKSKVVIIATTALLRSQIEKYAKHNNKLLVVLKSRGDKESITKAFANSYIVSDIDCVGGLEFDAAIIVGVDEGRVPPTENSDDIASHFINYSWHNRLYVAITRAKYALAIFGVSSRGISPMLESAIYARILNDPKS